LPGEKQAERSASRTWTDALLPLRLPSSVFVVRRGCGSAKNRSIRPWTSLPLSVSDFLSVLLFVDVSPRRRMQLGAFPVWQGTDEHIRCWPSSDGPRASEGGYSA